MSASMRWLPRTSISRTVPSAPGAARAGAARAGWRGRLPCAADGAAASAGARQAVAISSARTMVRKGGAVAFGFRGRAGGRRGP